LLEQEQQRITALLTKTLSTQLAERLQTVEFKLQLLVLQVQSGELSLEAYLQQLKASIQANKQLAIRLKQNGLTAEAREALRRAKTMEQEISEVEAQME
jgi:hypothetical protein